MSSAASGLARTFKPVATSTNNTISQILRWDNEDPYTVSIYERVNRVATIQQFLLDKSAGFTDYTRRQDFISRNFDRETDIGVKYLDALNYSEKMSEIFLRISQRIVEHMAHGADHKMDTSAPVSDNIRESIFNNFTKTYFDIARQEFCAKLKESPLSIVSTKDPYDGWVMVDPKEIESGEFGPVFLSQERFYTHTAKMVNTVCHEGTHHVMLQWASMAARGEIEVCDEMTDDVELILLPVELGSIANPLISKMYFADPFEKIAFATGDGVEGCYRKLNKLLKNIPPDEDCTPQKLLNILRMSRGPACF